MNSDAADADDLEDDEEDFPDAFDPPDPPQTKAGVLRALPAAAQAAEGPGCARCGNSCRSVYLWQGDLAEFKERDTKRWVELHGLQTFTKLLPGERTYWGVKLETPCEQLIETEPGAFGCAVYERRPHVCRIYEGVNPDGPQRGCGYFAGAAGAPSLRPERATRQLAEHELTRHDREQLQALLAACFPEHLSERTYRQQLPQLRLLTYEGETLVAQVGVEHRVVRAGDELVRVFGVIDLATHPDHRGQGLAGKLLERLELLARPHGVDAILLFTDDQRLYRRHRYKPAANPLTYLEIDEQRSVGLRERADPDDFMVLTIAQRPWSDAPLDLLGSLF